MADVPGTDAGLKLISCILHNKSEVHEVDWVEESFFANPHCGTLWGIVKRIASNGSDDVMIDTMEALNGKQPILLRVFQSAMNEVGQMGSGSATFYANKVALDHKRRVMLAAAHKAVSLIERGDPVDLDSILRDHWDELQLLSQFLSDSSVENYQWVVPGLLEKQERMIIVAPVKSGKSVLTRQFGLCAAAGRHPFDPRTTIPKQRVLMLDLENPVGILRRDMRRQVHGIREVDDMWVLHRPAGIDLGTPADRRMLEQAIIDCRPDLVMISPLYKVYDGLDQSWEMQAAGVQKPIDYWREKYGCAFWIEHQASKSDPTGLFGSSRWQRWFDAKVALVPEDPSLPPPHKVLEWQSTYRDSRRMAPEYIEMGPVLKDGDGSWIARFVDQEGFGIQLERACEG